MKDLKISEQVKGNKNPFYGKHHTEEQKLKWSKKYKGTKLSEETKLKMSESTKLYWKNKKEITCQKNF